MKLQDIPVLRPVYALRQFVPPLARLHPPQEPNHRTGNQTKSSGRTRECVDLISISGHQHERTCLTFKENTYGRTCRRKGARNWRLSLPVLQCSGPRHQRQENSGMPERAQDVRHSNWRTTTEGQLGTNANDRGRKGSRSTSTENDNELRDLYLSKIFISRRSSSLEYFSFFFDGEGNHQVKQNQQRDQTDWQ